MVKNIFRILKLTILCTIVFVSSSKVNVYEAKVTNSNLNKAVNLTTMAQKVDEFDYEALFSVKNTYTGDLTGYVYNCPACSGRLSCMANLDLSNGQTTYMDSAYGEVRIVASSANLSCGTIVRFNAPGVSNDPVLAIVLDRGVVGNDLDLLSEDVAYALSHVGRRTITYDVIRNGWETETYAS